MHLIVIKKTDNNNAAGRAECERGWDTKAMQTEAVALPVTLEATFSCRTPRCGAEVLCGRSSVV